LMIVSDAPNCGITFTIVIDNTSYKARTHLEYRHYS
jgi:hypothetical protein